MDDLLPLLIDRPDLAARIATKLPTLPNREGQILNSNIHQALKRKRFHERHAARARRLAAQLIAEAKAGGAVIWE